MKKIIVIPGSIRQASFNKSVARYLKSITPVDTEINIYELNDLPMFNADLEADLPKIVVDFIEAVRQSDAVIFSTPEYNNMTPGVLKNACEWLTRKYSADAVFKKPVGITGATDGGFGTVRSQNQLMLLAQIMKMDVDADLRLPISNAKQIFSEAGELTDTVVQERLKDFLAKVIAKIK